MPAVNLNDSTASLMGHRSGLQGRIKQLQRFVTARSAQEHINDALIEIVKIDQELLRRIITDEGNREDIIATIKQYRSF